MWCLGKDRMIGRISLIAHHLGSLLGGIALTICVHSHVEYDIFMLKLGRLYCTNRGLTCLFEKM